MAIMKKGLLVFLFFAMSFGAWSQSFLNPINFNNFKPGVSLATGKYPVSIKIADLDGDGKPDLIVANEGANSVSVFRNISSVGTLTSASFASKTDLAVSLGTGPESVIVKDIDGDGKPDLIVTSFNGNSVSVLRNTSSSGSISFASEVDFYVGNFAHTVCAGDIDGDGKADLLVANDNVGTVSLFRNTSSSGNISLAAPVLLKIGGNLSSVSLTDIDGDGKPEVLVTISNQNLVSVYHNSAVSGTIDAGSFPITSRVDINTGANPVALSATDVDGDGKPDLAIANEGSNTVSILKNTSSSGQVNFGPRFDFATGEHPTTLSIADLDGDTEPDIVVSNWYSSGSVSILQHTSVAGSISSTTYGIKVDIFTGQSPQSVAISDLDGDGRADMVTVNSGDNTVTILQNQFGGAGFLGTYSESTASTSIGSFVNTDLLDQEWKQDVPTGYTLAADDGTTINATGNAGSNAGRFIYFGSIGSQSPLIFVNSNLTFTAKGSGTIEVQILTAYNLGIAARHTFTLTSSYQDFSWAVGSLYPKLEYIVAVIFNGGNSSAQASGQFKKNFCLNIQQGGLSGAFTRYRADQTSLIGNSESSWYGRSYSDAAVHKKYLQHSGYARMRFHTDATHMVVEYVRDFYDKTILNLFPTPFFQTNVDWDSSGNIVSGYNIINAGTPVTPGQTYAISGLLTTNPSYVWFHNGVAMGAPVNLTNVGTTLAPLYQVTAPANADHLGLLIVRTSNIYNFLDPANDTFNSFVNCMVEKGAIGTISSFGTVPNAFMPFGGFTPSYISGLAVFINGALYKYYQIEGSDNALEVQYVVDDLPPGAKDVEIITPGQTGGVDPTVERGGTFLRAVYLPPSNTSISPAGTVAPGSICYIHDSILSGFVISSDAQNNVWMMKVKHDPSYGGFAGDVFSEGYGARFLHTDTQTPALLEAFAQKLASFGVDKYWFEVGSKDYQLGIPLTTYYTEYKALIERIKVLRPNAKFYIQSAPPFLAEGPNPETISDNGFVLTGPTLNDYRDVQRAIANSHSYCEYVDFENLFPPTIDNLPDGLHPSDAGNLLYANGLRDKSTLLGTVFPVTALSFYRPTIRHLIKGAATMSIVTAKGGVTPYNFSLVSGALPAGVSFNADGTFTGIPTQGGAFPLNIRVTDANSTAVNETVNLVVEAPVIVAAPLHILNGVVGSPYSKLIKGAGGYAPYTLTQTGTLPPGMMYNTTTGVLSGTPTTAGTYNFIITAIDHYGLTGYTGYTFTVGTTTPTPLTDQFYPTTDISSANLLVTAHLNDLYSQDVSAFIGGYVTQGGVERLVGGAGGAITVASGHFSGTAVNFGAINPTYGPVTSVRIFIAVISLSVVDGVNINFDTNTIIPVYLNATQSTSFSQNLLGALSYGQYTLTETGTLPAGLSFNSSTGTLSGTPTTLGTTTFSIGAANSWGDQITTNYTFTVGSPPVFTAGVYEDALENGWVDFFNSPTPNYANTTPVNHGTNSVAVMYGAFSTFSVANATALNVSSSGIGYFKFSVYGGAGSTTGNNLAVILNNNYASAAIYYASVTAGGWQTFNIPLSSLGNPSTINQIIIQEASGNTETIYLDDIGFN